MTTEVVCSGCGATVPWPQMHSVETAVDWLAEDGTRRRVAMRDLCTGDMFHVCSLRGDEGGGGPAHAGSTGSVGMVPESAAQGGSTGIHQRHRNHR